MKRQTKKEQQDYSAAKAEFEEITKRGLNLNDIIEDEESTSEDIPDYIFLVKDPHTMMVPSEENIVIIAGDFWESLTDMEHSVDLVFDFNTLERIYLYYKFRQAEINFNRNQF